MSKLKEYKEQPKSMFFLHHEDKSKNLVIESTKVYSNEKRIDSVTITRSTLDKCKRIAKNDVKAFRAILREYAVPGALSIDSKSMKLNLCNHDRTRIGLYNRVARFIERDDLAVEYSAQQKEQAKAVAKAKAAKK